MRYFIRLTVNLILTIAFVFFIDFPYTPNREYVYRESGVEE